MTVQPRGLLDEKTSWFVPWLELSDLDNINKPDFGKLRKVDSELQADDRFVEAEEPFTISLESFLIRGAHDSDNANDLLVRSFVRNGDEPKTETIHFFGTDIEAGTFQDNLESEHVFATRSFTASNRIWLAFEIQEIDQALDNDHSVASALNRMRGGFGAIFPALIPFAPVVGIAMNMVSRLQNLQETAAQTTPIFYNKLDLYAKDIAGGDAPLRYGAYIFFNEPVQGVQYQLGSGFKLKRRAAATRDTPILHDYMVVKITPGIVDSGKDIDKLLGNQQLATVLSELNTSDANEERRTLHFSFLKEVIESANQFRDLKEYRRLMAKKKIGDELTPFQKERLISIIERLGQFIPD